MSYEKALSAAEYIRAKLNVTPKVGLVLGSGLGDLARLIENSIEIPYGEIPGFACSTAPNHKGQFVVGTLCDVPVICMQGRLHLYEGHDPKDVVFPIRVLKLLGIEALIMTNAAGGINLDFEVGDLMVIDDHINFLGRNPLVGPNDDEFGPRFCDMTYAYSPKLRTLADHVAEKLGIKLHHGVYIACLGPNFETPAEIRAFRTMGADVVGMSTVPEVITAAHCGLPVLAISMISNMAAGVLDQPLTLEEVVEMGAKKAPIIEKLICGIVKEFK